MEIFKRNAREVSQKIVGGFVKAHDLRNAIREAEKGGAPRGVEPTCIAAVTRSISLGFGQSFYYPERTWLWTKNPRRPEPDPDDDPHGGGGRRMRFAA